MGDQPSGGTCSLGKGRVIDYFVVSRNLVPYVTGAFNIGDSMLPTHSAVRLIIGKKPRDDGVRCIKTPSSHAADLPAGPMQLCIPVDRIDDTDEQLGLNFRGCTEHLEQELNAIAGLEGEDAIKFCGRIEGPDFVWKKACDDKSSSARTTHVSRAWRLSAIWLKAVGRAGTKNYRRRLAACWKLFNYKHPPPKQVDEEQREQFKAFEAWRRVIATVQLDDHWVRVFTDMAEEKATQLERQAQKDQYHNTVNWIQDGPSKGLRKQHQFTKVRGGWVGAICNSSA